MSVFRRRRLTADQIHHAQRTHQRYSIDMHARNARHAVVELRTMR